MNNKIYFILSYRDRNHRVMNVLITLANMHDSQPLILLLDQIQLPPGTQLHDDKAYRRQERTLALKQRGLKNGLQYRASKSHPLTRRQAQFNRGVSRKKYQVECTFGGMKRWFGAGMARLWG